MGRESLCFNMSDMAEQNSMNFGSVLFWNTESLLLRFDYAIVCSILEDVMQ